METAIKYLKLPFYFSAPQMQQEVAAISEEWIAHYNQRDYEGTWTALPLRSINGSMQNVLANAGDAAVFADTPLMTKCPYLKTVVDSIQCEKMAVRLLNLKSGAIIKEHTDAELSFEQGEARIHVPVMTNEAVEFYLDGERVVMESGTCWYMDFNRKHRVANYGSTDRIHLVMDCIVNDWLRDLFMTGDWEVKCVDTVKDKHTTDEKRAIIQNLLTMNTPASLKMAAQMQAKLPM